jgi:NADPH:quinone reductase-like Zn-dependent oxidoreductase
MIYNGKVDETSCAIQRLIIAGSVNFPIPNHPLFMKAAVYDKYGPPEVVQIKDIKKPVPKDNEVLIQVHASTVNRTDCGFRGANYFIVRFFAGLFNPRVKVLGCEFAGEIETIGRSVTKFKPGDKVFGFNDDGFGGHAEYMVVKETGGIALIPDGINFEDAAPIAEGAHYAWCDLRAAKLSGGQRILINGTTGAIGSAAVQLAKHCGAEVTAVCDTKNIDLVKALGADRIIDYKKEDFLELKEQFDVIFDAVGKSSFGKCKPLLKPKGIYMSTELGPGYENPFLALITPLLGGKRLLFPLPFIKQEDVVFIGKLVSEQKFKPVIDSHYNLDQIVDAYRYVETGMKTGNVVIRIR